MVGSKMIYVIDSHLRRTFSNSAPFGVISVLITGGVAQLMPVMVTPMWTPLEETDDLKVKRGKLLYRTLDIVYHLSIIMRQGGETEEDKLYKDLIVKIGRNNVNLDYFNKFKTFWGSLDEVNSSTVALCASKNERNIINLEILREYTARVPIMIADAKFSASYRGPKVFEERNGLKFQKFLL